jgi:hypothetical protein
MGIRDERRHWRGADEGEPPAEREPTLIEVLEKAGSRITTAFVIAGAIIGLAVWARPSPPHYEAVIDGSGRVVRIDTRSGAMLRCDGGYCQSILRPGQHLDRAPTTPAAPAASAASPPRLPAPAAAPAATTVPAAQPAR